MSYRPKQIRMRQWEPYGCGRSLLANAVGGMDYDAASKYLPGQEHDGAKANARDSMIHHKVALWRLHQPSKIVTDDEILAGKCAIIKTCILVHAPEAPTLGQHWVNLGGLMTDEQIRAAILSDDLRPCSAAEWERAYGRMINYLNKKDGGSRYPFYVILWWNAHDEPIKMVSPKLFKSYYRRGSFNHAHEVGAGSVRKPAWYERFYFWVTVKI